MNTEMSSYHVATAAEAIAAAQFARLGYDVGIQYGANQPEYDLVVTQGARMMKVSVKGSQDGGWGLLQSLMGKHGLAKADYHGAADIWLRRHRPLTVYCLIQFRGVAFDAMPRVYLATPNEIADRLKASRGGVGHSSLKEDHTRGPRSKGAGMVERLPDDWRISTERIDGLLRAISSESGKPI